MITILRELITYDFKSFRWWLGKETFTKVFVMLLFGLLSFGLFISIHYFSKTFFNYLLTFEEFGQFTSTYILRASLLVVLWLGFISSLISSISFLLTNDRKKDFIFTLPVDTRSLVIYQNIKTIFLNILILTILILPIVLAYLSSSNIPAIPSLVRSSSLVLLVALIAESLGGSIGYITANRFKKAEGSLFVVSLVLIVVALTVLLFKTILSDQLNILYSSEPENFSALFAELPLNKFCLVNNNLAGIVISGFSPASIVVILFAILLYLVAYQTQTLLFRETWQQVRVNIEHRIFIFRHSPRSLSYPSLFQKDLVSILRSPKEMGYSLFLFAMLLGYIALFSRGIEVSRIPANISTSIVIFSWMWMSFYATTYFMRTIFPSMSKEGKTRWWLFTLPLLPQKILNSKIKMALLFSLPILVLSLLGWWTFPVDTNVPFMVIVSIIFLISISLAIAILGIIKPDYSLADDPEKVSTGLTGILALSTTVILGAIYGSVIYLVIQNMYSSYYAINSVLLISVVFLALLYFIALRSLKNHSVDIK